MISKKMADRINEQINREMFSAYLYLAMAAKMTEAGYKGVGNWFTIQFHEEMYHAMKFFNYLQDQGAAVELKALAKPEVKETSIKEFFQRSFEHEKGVTKSIMKSWRKRRKKRTMPPRSWPSGMSLSRSKKRRTPRKSSRRSTF
jgi:ferritin